QFSAAEATNRFLEENIRKIDEIFENVNRNFDNNINTLNEDIKVTENKIDRFQKDKEAIKLDLEKELQSIIKDEYRTILGISNLYTDEKFEQIANYKYASQKAINEKTFEKANRDNSSSNHYKKLGKNLFEKIIYEINIELENNININIFTKDRKDNIQEKLKTTTIQIQQKYENKYGVILNIKDIKIDSIKIELSNNIDLERGFFREVIDFMNFLTFGDEKKFINTTANEWEKYAKNEYKSQIDNEIKNKIENSKNIVKKEVDKEINNIVNTIEKQLNQELKDKEKFSKDKQKTRKDKDIVQGAFKYLQKEYIEKAKIQNQDIFYTPFNTNLILH
ncbi:MAG: hypothetical protein U9Q30_03885, partial [Campylobacterota bacterium]|nr:hypothetical protein [Campylobacterota bacterium]